MVIRRQCLNEQPVRRWIKYKLILQERRSGVSGKQSFTGYLFIIDDKPKCSPKLPDLRRIHFFGLINKEERVFGTVELIDDLPIIQPAGQYLDTISNYNFSRLSLDLIQLFRNKPLPCFKRGVREVHSAFSAHKADRYRVLAPTNIALFDDLQSLAKTPQTAEDRLASTLSPAV